MKKMVDLSMAKFRISWGPEAPEPRFQASPNMEKNHGEIWCAMILKKLLTNIESGVPPKNVMFVGL